MCVYLFAWVCVCVCFVLYTMCWPRKLHVLCITNGREDKKCNNYGLACCNGLISSSSANLCIILIISAYFWGPSSIQIFINTIRMIEPDASSLSSYCLFQQWSFDVINFDEWTIMSAQNSVGLILRKSSPTRSAQNWLQAIKLFNRFNRLWLPAQAMSGIHWIR